MKLVKLPTPKISNCLCNNELYYVQDNTTGFVILDNVDMEKAYVFASKQENCTAYKKIRYR